MKINLDNIWKWLPLWTFLSATACSNVNFVPTDSSLKEGAQATTPKTPPGSTTCTGNLGSTTRLTKMIFVLDMSGSNSSSPGCALGPNCTDDGKKMRAGSIQKFFDDYGSHSNFTWALEVFQGTTASALTGGTNLGFTNALGMQSAITNFESLPDAGDTPYVAALDMARAAIAGDADLNSVKNPQYIIVFMSDGQPDGAGDTPGTILGEIAAIEALSPGKISFNSVYYGNGDLTPAGLLQSMAAAGDGNFLNTNSNPTGLDFKISDLINVPCP